MAVALLVLAFILDVWLTPLPLYKALALDLWSASDNFLLIAIPLFILLGEILVRSGVARTTYAAVQPLLSRLPGGLIHANIGTCALFSATSGSSVATAATVGTVAIPEGERLGYDRRLFAGSIAAGGTLGIMIPPSIDLIIYGFLTKTSVVALFEAGIIPGLLLALLFSLVTAVICLIKPEMGGKRHNEKFSTSLKALLKAWPILLLFFIIVGAIYSGIATPTEAAAFGVVGALALAALARKLTLKVLIESLNSTVTKTSVIIFIIIAAYYLNYVLSSVGVSDEIQQLVASSGASQFEVLVFIMVIYLILGCFIETLSLMVLTLPILIPIIKQAGIDPVWFGIFVILLIEMALITPPVGLNLYIVHSVRERGSIKDVMYGAIPFVLIMIVFAFLLIAFPGLATWLPSVLN